MFRRLLLALSVLILAAALTGAALAARVHIRVEGKTQTIFGANDPWASSPTTALEALQKASVAGEFYIHLQQSSFGPYIDQIGLYPGAGSGGWVFKVNGASPPIGADKVTLKDGDSVLWYWAVFDASGNGPATLRLAALSGGCYQVYAQDSAGKETPADGAILVVNGKPMATGAGKACPGAHTGWVRATLAGAVRSNVLR